MFLGRRLRTSAISIDMTPMIDVVFQLLAFFLLTFQVVAQEGDFSVRMPRARPSATPDEAPTPPVHVRLKAGAGGSLAVIELAGRPVANFDELHERVRQLMQSSADSDALEVELDCDAELEYRHVIDAVTAVSGHVSPDGRVTRLLNKLRFAPRRE